jgi:hypothetical protein
MKEPQKPDYLDIQFDGDVCLATLRGNYDLATEAYLRFVREELDARHGYRLTILYVHDAGTVTHEARQALVAWNKNQQAPGALALVGASFTVRTLANMVLAAIRLLTRMRTQYAFFSSDADARTWIDKERVRLRAVLGRRSAPGGSG